MLISPCKKWLLIDQEYKVLNLVHCSFYELLLIYFRVSMLMTSPHFFSPNRCATVRINFFQSCEKVKLPFYSVTLNMQKSFHRWLLFLLLTLSLSCSFFIGIRVECDLCEALLTFPIIFAGGLGMQLSFRVFA